MSARLWSCMASAVRMLTPNSSSTAAMKPRLATESHPDVVLCDASAPTLSSEAPMTSASKEVSLVSERPATWFSAGFRSLRLRSQY